MNAAAMSKKKIAFYILMWHCYTLKQGFLYATVKTDIIYQGQVLK